MLDVRQAAPYARLITMMLLALVPACAETPSAPEQPTPGNGLTFRSESMTVDPAKWFSYETTFPGRPPREILLPFEANARAATCKTERMASESRAVAHAGARINEFAGVLATCTDGVIALATMQDGKVWIGCALPSSQVQCDALLRRISDARQ